MCIGEESQEGMTKTCAHCKTIKPLTDFYKDNNNRDKKSYMCIPCQKIKGDKWRAANPEKARAMNLKAWRKRRREKPEAGAVYLRNFTAAVERKKK